MRSKKGMGLKDITPFALLFVVSIIALTVGTQVLEDIKSDQCDFGMNSSSTTCLNSTGGATGTLGDTTASNATANGISGMETFASWYPTLALITAAAIVLGVLFVFLRR